MSQNTTPSLLDVHQIVKRAYEETDDAVRVKVASGTSFSVALAASDNDSVIVVGTTDGTVSGTQKALKLSSSGVALVDGSAVTQPISGSITNTASTLTPQKASLTSASTGVVIPAVSVVGMKTFNLVTNTTSTIIGAQVLTLEISPHDTDNVWVATGLTVTPSLTSGVTAIGTVLSTVARRARVSIAAAITSGTLDVYLIAQGV